MRARQSHTSYQHFASAPEIEQKDPLNPLLKKCLPLLLLCIARLERQNQVSFAAIYICKIQQNPHPFYLSPQFQQGIWAASRFAQKHYLGISGLMCFFYQLSALKLHPAIAWRCFGMTPNRINPNPSHSDDDEESPLFVSAYKNEREIFG
jgi:hypothetical protein